MVEVAPSAERHLDAAVVRRLVTLEVGDVEVPAPVAAQTASSSPGVYVRIYFAEDRLVVELWDRGELQGQRRISASGGTPLAARRIALASGELARRLRERRLAEARAQRREQARAAAEQQDSRAFRVSVLPYFAPELRGGWASSGDALFAGPRLRFGVRTEAGQDLGLGVSFLGARAFGVHAEPTLASYELELSPGQLLPLGRGHELRFGAAAALAVVHVQGARVWSEQQSFASETWTARGGLEARYRYPLGQHWHFETGVEAGALLRRLWLRTEDGAREGMGGLWTGLFAGVGFM